jgi:hypothetical protein
MERARTAGRRAGAEARRGADGRRAELEPREAAVDWLRLDAAERPRAGADDVERVKTFLRD